MGIFGVLSLGKQGIFASQFGLNTTSNNITNANTPGYARERASFVPSYPQYTAFGPLGNGVDVATVQRLRDRALDFQYWNQHSFLGNAESKEKYLDQIQYIFNDLNGNGFSNALDDFWNSWMDLSNHPADMASRSLVIEKSKALVSKFHEKASRLQSLSASMVNDIQLTVNRINTLSKQIADINNKIVQTAGAKFDNITLMDKRDQLIDELSSLINVSATDGKNGVTNVNVGSVSLVDGVTANLLELDQSKAQAALKFKNGSDIEDVGGKIGGLLEINNHVISKLKTQLNDFAKNFVSSVNTLHKKYYGLDGYNGRNFFDPAGISADTIALNKELIKDPKQIAVSSDGSIGDNSGALALAHLKDQAVMNSGESTFSEFYGQLISEVGEMADQNALSISENRAIVQSLDNQRQSVMGVSIEEEMVNMIKYQHSLQAASKVISTTDEMIQSILNMVR
ncbi:MAG: flagellar hook-associated protein FlgK [Calditrichaeota bacterium]|nr:flagellar hook-associated protein FlgK [Calditrichota bacterium]